METSVGPSGNDIKLSNYERSGCHGDCLIELECR